MITMNGTGYDFAAAYNQYETLESLAQSLNEQHSHASKQNHHQPVGGYRPGLAAAAYLATGNRPEAPSYDPTRGNSTSSNNASVQHRLLVSAYGHPSASMTGSTSQQPNSMAAFLSSLGQPGALAGFQTMLQLQQDQNHRQQHQQSWNPMGVSPRLTSHKHTPNQQSTQHQPSQHLRKSSFEDLLLLHPSILASGADSFSSSLALPNNVLSSGFAIQSPLGVLACSQNEEDEPWLKEIRINIPSLSLDPMDGVEIKRRLRGNMKDVLTRYIPCVDFLVQCQQDLRKGLEYATQRHRYKSRRGSHNMTPSEFFSVYVDQLPASFYNKNFGSMDQTALDEAYEGLKQLRTDAKNSERQGCEAVKSNFLGGMKDGESWGLRKWLSRHGNALQVCTDLECIMNALQKLDRSEEYTVKFAALIRPMAKAVLDKLRKDIPTSYQQRSSAHPYLPFFHRLEAALRGMSTFDPEEDDVICLDDSDEEDEVVVEQVRSVMPTNVPTQPIQQVTETKKRKASDEPDEVLDLETDDSPTLLIKHSTQVVTDDRVDEDSSSGESDTESVVEILEAKPIYDIGEENGEPNWTCEKCSTVNRGAYLLCQSCGDLNHFLKFEDVENNEVRRESSESVDCASLSSSSVEQDRPSKRNKRKIPNCITNTGSQIWPILPTNTDAALNSALAMAQNMIRLATLFDECREYSVVPKHVSGGHFWCGRRFADALRLFVDLLRRPESPHFVEQVDEDSLIQAGKPPFSHVIKHPICFRDIVAALIEDVEKQTNIQSSKLEGALPNRGLSKWNMWNGIELLQAIDLVLLNSLAYGKALKQGKSQHRSKTNQIRKDFWNGITNIISNNIDNDSDSIKRYLPTRRSESSGFIVYKISET